MSEQDSGQPELVFSRPKSTGLVFGASEPEPSEAFTRSINGRAIITGESA